MKSLRRGFLNVDVDLKSRTDPAALVTAWDGLVLTQHLKRSAGAHWIRFNLPFQPKSPGEVIRHRQPEK